MRLLGGGDSHRRYPNGLPWARDSLDDVPFLDPGWRGKTAAEVISMLVTDVVALETACSAAIAAAQAHPTAAGLSSQTLTPSEIISGALALTRPRPHLL